MPNWGYDPRVHNYRNLDTGRFVNRRKVLTWSDDFLETTQGNSDALCDLLINDQLTLGDWQGQMQELIKQTYISEYVVGRGGLEQMTPRDWGILGYDIRDQYQWLDKFAQDIAAGKVSPLELKRRARMYISGAHQMFQRGRTEAFGMPRLPAYPADGQQECLTNDRCDWLVQEVKENGVLVGWNATWRLDPNAEHCTDCPENARLWNPLFVPAGMTEEEENAWRIAEQEKMRRARGLSAEDFFALGGPGSGNWGHSGRPGKRGGSAKTKQVVVQTRSGGRSVASIEADIKKQAAKRQSLSDRIDNLEAKIQDHNKTLTALFDGSIDLSDEEIRAIESDIRSIKSKQSDIQQLINQADDRISELRVENELATSNLPAKEKIAAKRADLAKLRSFVAEGEAITKEQLAMVDEAYNEFQSIQNRFFETGEEKQALWDEWRETDDKLRQKELKKQIAELEKREDVELEATNQARDAYEKSRLDAAKINRPYREAEERLTIFERELLDYGSSVVVEAEMMRYKEEAARVRTRFEGIKRKQKQQQARDKAAQETYEEKLKAAENLPETERMAAVEVATKEFDDYINSSGFVSFERDALKLLYQDTALPKGAVSITGEVPTGEYIQPEKNWSRGIDAFGKIIGNNEVYASMGAEVTWSKNDPRPGKNVDSGRAYAHKKTAFLSKSDLQRVVIHELGHTLENNDPIIKAQVRDFYNRRTQGERVESLAQITGKAYGLQEVTKKDKFIAPYMGKVYYTGHTEILSMGLELFYTDPLRFAREDPEMFDFIYSVVRVGL